MSCASVPHRMNVSQMSPDAPPSLIFPDWKAPACVQAVTTTRWGGVSDAPYATFNVAAHVGDNPHAVAVNRRRLCTAMGWSQEPKWLRQVHGTAIVHAAHVVPDETQADACYADQPGLWCAVLTADCLPVLLCDDAGTWVASVHCGWRGLLNGILAATVAIFPAPGHLMAWLGPAIGPDAFEIGSEVYKAFVQTDEGYARYFRPSPAGRWLADIYGLARHQLHRVGVTAVYGGAHCTVTESQRFFSYRRASQTGRMASVIGLTAV